MSAKISPTVGHHFSDILICKQKAWLHYHGNSREKMKPPAHLRAMQVEGQDLEKKIYETRYAGAVKIPGLGTKSIIRLEETKKAMQKGEPFILQGYVETPLGNGTMDVMEKVGPDSNSSIGFAYRVGEIKRSEKLMTAHIMQVSWYTELLEQAYGQKVKDAFFILGGRDDQLHVENLDSYALDYQAVKEALFELRDRIDDPGPHLIPSCQTCDWRGVCMPRLLHENNLSLLPVMTQNQASFFKSLGAEKWQDISAVDDDTLLGSELNPFSIELIRKGYENLSAGLAPLRNHFRKNLFDDAVVVSLDFQILPSQRKSADEGLHPTAIHWEDNNAIHTIEIIYDHTENGHADLSELMLKRMLIFYGGTDLGAFARIMRQDHDGKYPKLFDLFGFVEKYVHAPFLGLELNFLFQHIAHQAIEPTGKQRVVALRQVVQWISNSL